MVSTKREAEARNFLYHIPTCSRFPGGILSAWMPPEESVEQQHTHTPTHPILTHRHTLFLVFFHTANSLFYSLSLSLSLAPVM